MSVQGQASGIWTLEMIGIVFFPIIGIGFKQTLHIGIGIGTYWKSTNAQLFNLILVLEK